MPSAPPFAGLSSQTPQGNGARFFRRLGQAVRGAVANGIALAGRLRRRSNPHAAEPARRTPSPPRRPRRARNADAPFTPATHPGLTPQACALLNTPVEDCDPALIRLILAALAGQLARQASPGAQPVDARALFATLCERLDLPPDEPGPDEPAPEPPVCPATRHTTAEPDARPPAPRAATAIPTPRHRPQAWRQVRRPRRAPLRAPAWRLGYAACAGPP